MTRDNKIYTVTSFAAIDLIFNEITIFFFFLFYELVFKLNIQPRHLTTTEEFKKGVTDYHENILFLY